MSALPDGWSISGTADGVAIQLPPGSAHYASCELTRDELGVLMEHLFAAIIAANPLEAPATLKSLESLDAAQLVEGWAVYVQNSVVILDIGPLHQSGRQSLNLEEAAALWRSLASAYWLASPDVQALFQQSVGGDDLAVKRMNWFLDADARQAEHEDWKWATEDDDDESSGDGPW